MILFLFCFIPVDLDYMALQNRVGLTLGREIFSFQFHLEKKVKLAQNA